MEFRLLGRLEVEANGVDLTPARKQHRVLIAVLLLHQGEVVATDDLGEALWGDGPPETAHKAIHGHISALRKLLGAERVETRPPGYLLRLAKGDELDICRVEAIAGVAPGDDGPARSEKLREALALFRGEPLAEFRYEAFASEEAARLEALRLAVLEEQIESERQFLARLAPRRWTLRGTGLLHLRAGVPLACGDLCQLGGEIGRRLARAPSRRPTLLSRLNASASSQVRVWSALRASSRRKITFKALTVSAAGGSSQGDDAEPRSLPRVPVLRTGE